MAAEQKPPENNRAYHYVFRGLLGLIIGVLAGAAIGACLFILLSGPGDYFKSVHDNRPAGIVSGSGTESGFTLAVTFAFAFYGAIGGAILGLFAGLRSAIKAAR
jgi:hypothetical protein